MMIQAESKLVLTQEGNKVIIPTNNILITLSWLAAVDLDLQAVAAPRRVRVAIHQFDAFVGIVDADSILLDEFRFLLCPPGNHDRAFSIRF